MDLCANCAQREGIYEEVTPSGRCVLLCEDCDQYAWQILEELDAETEE